MSYQFSQESHDQLQCQAQYYIALYRNRIDPRALPHWALVASPSDSRIRNPIGIGNYVFQIGNRNQLGETVPWFSGNRGNVNLMQSSNLIGCIKLPPFLVEKSIKDIVYESANFPAQQPSPDVRWSCAIWIIGVLHYYHAREELRFPYSSVSTFYTRLYAAVLSHAERLMGIPRSQWNQWQGLPILNLLD